MDEQLSLFEMPRSSPPKYSLFLATFPDFSTARRIAELGNQLRQKHRLRGLVRPVTHLNISLHPIGGLDAVPDSLAASIGRICKPVMARMKPFEVCLDQVMSFGRSDKFALVLVGNNDNNVELKSLHGLLRAELAKYVRPFRSPSQFTPHITLLYDKEQTPKPVQPVHWTVEEIVLVCSEVGATKYERLGRWLLGLGNDTVSRF